MVALTLKALAARLAAVEAQVEKLTLAIQPVEPTRREVQVTAVPSTDSVQVSWSVTEAEHVTSFLVSRNGTDSSGGGPWGITRAAGDRSHMFLKLNPAEYEFTVEATYADGVVVKGSAKATPTAAPIPAPESKTGVTTKGTDLFIDGKRRQVAGWNLFGASGCHQGKPYSDGDLDAFFKSIPPRTPTRTWGFQAQGLDNLRHVVRAAERNDQLLIVALGDGVSHCGHLEGASKGQGSAKTTAWYRSQYKGAYRSWVDQVTREFADSLAIAGFEPMNEPIGQAGDVLRAFNDDIGGLCHQNAPGKLVFSGQRGLYDFPDGINGWKLAHASPGIDVCSQHEYDYGFQASRRIVTGWWDQAWAAAQELRKPLIIGEVGIGVPGTTGATQQIRADAMRQKFDAYFDRGAAAVLVWNRYLGPSGEEYAVKDNADPLVAVVRGESR